MFKGRFYAFLDLLNQRGIYNICGMAITWGLMSSSVDIYILILSSETTGWLNELDR